MNSVNDVLTHLLEAMFSLTQRLKEAPAVTIALATTIITSISLDHAGVRLDTTGTYLLRLARNAR